MTVSTTTTTTTTILRLSFISNLILSFLIINILIICQPIDATRNRSSSSTVTLRASRTIPFSAKHAFQRYAYLPHQPLWTKSLFKVEFLDKLPPQYPTPPPPKSIKEKHYNDMILSSISTDMLPETKWTAKLVGIPIRWTARITLFSVQPNKCIISWQSTSGAYNRGSVIFENITPNSGTNILVSHHNNNNNNNNINSGLSSLLFDLRSKMTQIKQQSEPKFKQNCLMTMEMEAKAPKPMAIIFRKSSRLVRFMNKCVLQPSLLKFEQVLNE